MRSSSSEDSRARRSLGQRDESIRRLLGSALRRVQQDWGGLADGAPPAAVEEEEEDTQEDVGDEEDKARRECAKAIVGLVVGAVTDKLSQEAGATQLLAATSIQPSGDVTPSSSSSRGARKSGVPTDAAEEPAEAWRGTRSWAKSLKALAPAALRQDIEVSESAPASSPPQMRWVEQRLFAEEERMLVAAAKTREACRLHGTIVAKEAWAELKAESQAVSRWHLGDVNAELEKQQLKVQVLEAAVERTQKKAENNKIALQRWIERTEEQEKEKLRWETERIHLEEKLRSLRERAPAPAAIESLRAQLAEDRVRWKCEMQEVARACQNITPDSLEDDVLQEALAEGARKALDQLQLPQESGASQNSARSEMGGGDISAGSPRSWMMSASPSAPSSVQNVRQYPPTRPDLDEGAAPFSPVNSRSFRWSNTAPAPWRLGGSPAHQGSVNNLNPLMSAGRQGSVSSVSSANWPRPQDSRQSIDLSASPAAQSTSTPLSLNISRASVGEDTRRASLADLWAENRAGLLSGSPASPPRSTQSVLFAPRG